MGNLSAGVFCKSCRGIGMKYINVITGNIIDIDSEIRGENWELVRASDSLEEKVGEIDSLSEESAANVASSKAKTAKKK